MDRLVNVRTFKSEIDAEIAATLLREENIETYIHSDDAGGFEPQLQITRGVDLLVESRDHGKAVRILENAESSSQD